MNKKTLKFVALYMAIIMGALACFFVIIVGLIHAIPDRPPSRMDGYFKCLDRCTEIRNHWGKDETRECVKVCEKYAVPTDASTEAL